MLEEVRQKRASQFECENKESSGVHLWRIVRLLSVTDKHHPCAKGGAEQLDFTSLVQTLWMEVQKLCVRGC